MIMTNEADVLKAALQEELVNLWADLDIARGNQLANQWSIRCGELSERIGTLSRLVGPASWRDVDISLLEDGVYQGLHAAWEIEAPPVDMQRVAEVRAAIEAGRCAP